MASHAAPAALTLRRYGPAPGSHSHDHFQVLLGLSGTLELEIDGRGLRVPPGHGCVIAPQARHDFESSRGSLCLVLDSYHADWSQRATQLQGLPHLYALARYLSQAVEQGLPLAQQHGPALLMEAWARLPDGHKPAADPHLRRAARPIDWWGLQQWAQGHWHQQLTVADLAQRAHLSPSQFAARCRSDQGMSAMQWLRQQRLHQARELRAQGMPVAEAARRTGYRSPSALTAALRRLER
ncbi:helix-turn-helix domain-containing protein [Acidovorax sp. DW039]|uniref:AraC family transcriptional regulator n=1 Tax=Acidovorax sp. DW039 TaxID=3095606 RepID=UPI00308977F2|nr:helix-turn-helix domain-containing protein [Acidovorax sp. DW039]